MPSVRTRTGRHLLTLTLLLSSLSGGPANAQVTTGTTGPPLTLDGLMARGRIAAVRVLAHRHVGLTEVVPQRNRGRRPIEITNIGTGVRFGMANRVVTSLSVIAWADSIEVEVGTRRLPAILLAADPMNDLALLSVNDLLSSNAPPPPSAATARTGDMVVMVDTVGDELNLQIGRVTGIHSTGLIVTSLTIHPGHSGAPLMNEEGEVVGVVAFATEERSNRTGAGNAVAIPSVMVAHIASELEQYGQVRRGYFGAVSDETVTAGVRLQEVDQDGPAALAGLRAGDEVVSYAGQAILDPAHLRELVLATVPGTAVPVEIRREEEQLEITVVIGDGTAALAEQLGAATHSPESPDLWAVVRWIELLNEFDALVRSPGFDPGQPDIRTRLVRMEQTLEELRRTSTIPPGTPRLPRL